ncbi:beta-glucosidase [Sphingopyxis sp. C-1]|uniref:beta-glucosidase family protein n=1 Tax=Sphingopyxis sp. C-1 TaxID=262667 RepID=UPI0006C430C2|nr:glycoside hydrolase family 3 C-terminal domain-containing protein [Sphingopyxis sp. C-1]GAO79403.1 beta-glucosidase [Sphingopyxis sp. C-1]
MSDQQFDFAPRRGASDEWIVDTIDAIMAQATLAEKVGMLSGRGFFQEFMADDRLWGARPYRAGSGIERLGVPPLWFTDGPRGVARGQSTCFPCTMARGATFDTDLEMRIGEAMGKEIRAQDCDLSGAVCINILRHPAWGRAQETYGEDPHHLGAMGAALGVGIQTQNVIATVKHFALNSMENARFKVDVQVSERALHEVYLPHFKTALDAGVATVMSAYNKFNGEYCGQHHGLLTDILRGEWGFSGFVHSDWVMGLYKPYAVAAGLDIENPEPQILGDKLIAAVEAGHVAPFVIDRACRNILRTQYRFACAADPLTEYPAELVASPEHVALAREAAQKSIVLLENDGVLPLDRSKLHRIAVLGRLAELPNTGDMGSSRVRPPYVVTPLDALRARLGPDAIQTGNEDDIDAAVAAARTADVALIVAGYTAREEGEYIPGDITLGQEDDGRGGRPAIGGDRLSLELPAEQVALIEAVAATGTPVVVAIVAGSAVLVEGWRAQASAILQTFYAGMEGGNALADILFGDVSPSGRLPFTVARDAGDYPHFDRDANAITYDYWHGYAKLARDGTEPRYPFGHGLSYTRFARRALQASVSGESVGISVAVANVGERSGDETVLCYIKYPGAIERWPLALKAFSRVSLAPGETRTIAMQIKIADLRYRDEHDHEWKIEPGEYQIHISGGIEADLKASVRL